MGTDLIQTWDFLVVTASDEAQGRAYEAQLEKRQQRGYLRGIGETVVVSDPDGVRIGSGGSTLLAIARVLEILGCDAGDAAAVEEILGRQRILIVHGGGDSRRLPCYGPAGKVFLPFPDDRMSALSPTLFDRLLPPLQALPAPAGTGQVVISSGDVLLEFNPEQVSFAPSGITGLACRVLPETAARHGVYLLSKNGQVLRFFQKPSLEVQKHENITGPDGRSLLDTGIMNLAPDACAALLALCRPHSATDAGVRWLGPLGDAATRGGLDFYTEVCCALGKEVLFEAYRETLRAAGSRLDGGALHALYDALRNLPFQACTLPQCRFLHFGSLPHLVSSGHELLGHNSHESPGRVIVNTTVDERGYIEGGAAWVEGCSVQSGLRLGGENVAIGLDIGLPLSLPPGACLDVIPGRDGQGKPFFCLRVCRITDNPKVSLPHGATWCDVPLAEIPAIAAIDEQALWSEALPKEERSLWHARVHPVVGEAGDYADWLWLFDLENGDAASWKRWRETPRYSMAQMALLFDHDSFRARRERLHARGILPKMLEALGEGDRPSARELAMALLGSDDNGEGLAERFCTLIAEFAESGPQPSLRSLGFAGALHTLGAVVSMMAQTRPEWIDAWEGLLARRSNPPVRAWLDARGLTGNQTAIQWTRQVQAEAFAQVRRTVVTGAPTIRTYPTSRLQKNAVVWGRAPARLDLAGGWTDTPPYTFERGGCVLNAAVDLDGRAPIQAYGRVIPQPFIRLISREQATRLEINTIDELLDYGAPANEFALPKAVLTLALLGVDGLSSHTHTSLKDILTRFGGGIELTTHATVPTGSGLGVSSIMGALLLAIVHRIMGRTLTQRDLFYDVLRIEQSLTTGGGWQDQLGGIIPGVKIISTKPGLVPEPEVSPVAENLLESSGLGETTLLYYTGITRLAKNIVEKIVARYLDRERATLATLDRIKSLVPRVAETMKNGCHASFGEALAAGWELKKELEPSATNPEIEALFEKIRPYLHGAKIMGAGGGGFLLLVCKSPEAACKLREMLESEPPNPAARFFDIRVNRRGLVVTVPGF